MLNPYANLLPAAFWKTGVATHNPLEIKDLWKSKFEICTKDLVTTAGSCFAQHISRAMIARGFNWLDSEPMPNHLPRDFGRSHGYGVFSFRTGNIYSTSLLRQWVEAAFEIKQLDGEIWERNGRFFDPLRPNIEPAGFSSEKECLIMRENSLKAIKKTLSETTLFVFTLGLTESWRNARTGMTYAACPGTIEGEFDPELHEFHNLTYPEIYEDLSSVINTIRGYNSKLRVLLTVSPVPLTATASTSHVLPATIYSKSVLRAVAGDVATISNDVDYFPSFEIISSHPFRGYFYEPNLREVAKPGVDHVMQCFFNGISDISSADGQPRPQDTHTLPVAQHATGNDKKFLVECEDSLLEAFSK